VAQLAIGLVGLANFFLGGVIILLPVGLIETFINSCVLIIINF